MQRSFNNRRDEPLQQRAIDGAGVLLALVLELDARIEFERQLFLGADHGAAQTLDAFGIRRKVAMPFALNIFKCNTKQQVVYVVAAEMRVAIGRQHFENSVVQAEYRNIEGSPAEIVDRDDTVLAFVETISKRRRCRFVHQAQHVKPGKTPGIFRGLSLRVVEVRGHGDNGLAHRHAKRRFGIVLQSWRTRQPKSRAA